MPTKSNNTGGHGGARPGAGGERKKSVVKEKAAESREILCTKTGNSDAFFGKMT